MSKLCEVTFITIYIYNSQNTGHTAELTEEQSTTIGFTPASAVRRKLFFRASLNNTSPLKLLMRQNNQKTYENKDAVKTCTRTDYIPKIKRQIKNNNKNKNKTLKI